MEPLSVAASITGLITAVRAVGNEIRRLSGANDSLADLDSLVRGFTDSCDSVHSILRRLPHGIYRDISNRDPRFWRKLQKSVTNLDTRNGRLAEHVRSIQDTRASFGGRTRAAFRVRWSEQRITDMKEITRDMQAQASMMLTLLNT